MLQWLAVTKVTSPVTQILVVDINRASMGFVPVSYTHLDVYKRQALLSGWDDPAAGLFDCYQAGVVM